MEIFKNSPEKSGLKYFDCITVTIKLVKTFNLLSFLKNDHLKMSACIIILLKEV